MNPAEELAEVKRREAEFRLKTVQEFLAFGARDREQRRQIDALNDELGERNSYIHRLHGEREDFVRREQAAFADVEAFTHLLATAEAEAAAARAELARLRAPRGWRRWFASKSAAARDPAALPAGDGPAPAASFVAVPPGDFIYYLHTPPFRLYRAASFTLRGWALPRDARPVTGVRVRIGGREFIGETGLEEPGVLAQHGPQPANPRPGFSVTFATPPGRHHLSLEAQLDHRDWLAVLTTPIWCQVPPSP